MKTNKVGLTKSCFSKNVLPAMLLSLAACFSAVSCSNLENNESAATEVEEIFLTERAAANQKTKTYTAFNSDSGAVSYNSTYKFYTIDGSKVKNGWNFATVDLREFDNQTVTINFSASMHAINNGNGTDLVWNVNNSGYEIIAKSNFPRGDSTWRTVSGSKTVKLGSNSVLYLSSYGLNTGNFKINIAELNVKVTGTTSGSGNNGGNESSSGGNTNNGGETATNGSDNIANIPWGNAGSTMQKKLSARDLKGVANNNPICATKFTADPCVLVYGDTVYVYGTNDMQQAEYSLCNSENKFDRINTLNCYSSKDLVNWTDCGEIKVSSWNKNSWAPAICTKKINGKDKFFIYFADNGSGIGVLESDSPTGPFRDPLGRQLISRSTPNTQGVYWLFDPAVFVDTDGRAYLYYGGGVQGDNAHPKSARCVELGDDMISIKGTPRTIDAPWLFEDSGINKFGNKYYYTYCSNWASRGGDRNAPPIASIAYMVSDSPLGPFTYAGYTMLNPNNGNDHHWIFTFKGKNYIAYHTQHISEKVNASGGGYRNVYINEFKVNGNGTLPIQTTNTSGVSQVTAFNPYTKVAAATMHNSNNVVVNSNRSVSSSGSNSYICVKGVNLSKGVKSIDMNFASSCRNGGVEIRVGGTNGTKLCSVNASGKTSVSVKTSYAAQTSNQDVYIILKGDVSFKDWKFN